MNNSKPLQKLVNDFKTLNGGAPILARDAAAWIYKNKKWQPSLSTIIDLLAKEISDAMRTEYFEDEKGRRVRKKHAVRRKMQDEFGKWKQLVFWDNIDTANPQFMEQSFSQRRGAIADECWQLKQDVDHYNENFNHAKPLQLWLDFSDDVADREAGLTEPESESNEAELDAAIV
jgi:hypothetical protein